jgi:hypothetical protein
LPVAVLASIPAWAQMSLTDTVVVLDHTSENCRKAGRKSSSF